MNRPLAILQRLCAPIGRHIWAPLNRPNLSTRLAQLCDPAIEHRGDDLADQAIAERLLAELDDLALRRHTDVSLDWARTGGIPTEPWEG